MNAHELFELEQESALGVVDAWTSDESDSTAAHATASASAHATAAHVGHSAVDEIARAFGIDAVV